MTHHTTENCCYYNKTTVTIQQNPHYCLYYKKITYIKLTAAAREVRRTIANEPVDLFPADPLVLTWRRGAFKDFSLTPGEKQRSRLVLPTWSTAGLILGFCPANERRRYKVTRLSLAGRQPRISPQQYSVLTTSIPYACPYLDRYGCPYLDRYGCLLTWPELTLKHRETPGCVVSTLATDARVLKHQAISIYNAD